MHYILEVHHDAIIKWKHLPCYWPFVQGIHQSLVNSPHQGFHVSFDLSLNKGLSKQSRRWWFEMPSCSLWRHCNICMVTEQLWIQSTAHLWKLRVVMMATYSVTIHCHLSRQCWHHDNCWFTVTVSLQGSSLTSSYYSISQEICTRFLLCCALLWLYIDWFSHIHQAYFTGTVAI